MKRPVPPLVSAERNAEAEKAAAVLMALEFDVACSARISRQVLGIVTYMEERCTAPAAWMTTCRYCGIQKLMCDPHRLYVLGSPRIHCTCGTHAPGIDLLVFTALPVGK